MNRFLTVHPARLLFITGSWYTPQFDSCFFLSYLYQNSRFRYLSFNSPNCSYSIVLRFPFRYPIKLHTAIFGGIATSIWIWSDTLLLRWFLHLSIRITASVSPLPLLSFADKTLVSDISVQIRYDTCSSISCAINYGCHSCTWISPYYFVRAMADCTPIIAGGFFYPYRHRLFSTTRPASGFLYTQKGGCPFRAASRWFNHTMIYPKDGVYSPVQIHWGRVGLSDQAPNFRFI